MTSLGAIARSSDSSLTHTLPAYWRKLLRTFNTKITHLRDVSIPPRLREFLVATILREVVNSRY
jgi:hypothetical protein